MKLKIKTLRRANNNKEMDGKELKLTFHLDKVEIVDCSNNM
jgi:hypothetical protein